MVKILSGSLSGLPFLLKFYQDRIIIRQRNKGIPEAQKGTAQMVRVIEENGKIMILYDSSVPAKESLEEIIQALLAFEESHLNQ